MYDDGTLSGVRRPMYFLIPPRNSRAFRSKYKLSYPAGGEASSIAESATLVIVGNGESRRAGGPKVSNNPRLFACSISVCGTPSRQSNNRRGRDWPVIFNPCSFGVYPWLLLSDES